MNEEAAGFAYTTGAFAFWGLAPVFWKAVKHVPAEELLAQRVIWCGLLMVAVLSWQRSWAGLRAILRRRRALAILAGTAALLGCNWFVFIWAVNSDRVLEASLGYFINPLFSVVLGMVFLGERLRRWQVVSVALAALGVLGLAWRVGTVPWISLVLALTFGFYGLVRKRAEASPEEGVTVEMWLLTPAALGYLIWLETAGRGAFGHTGLATGVLLVATGAVTALPLVWFAHGARRLPLATVGLLQYLAPTMQFLLAVLVYKEPFEAPQVVAFLCIWTALAIYSIDAHASWRRLRRPTVA